MLTQKIIKSSVDRDEMEDLPGCWRVTCQDARGRFYWHERMDLTALQAERMVNELRVRGVIDLRHWHDHAPYGTQAYCDDGLEERQIEDEKMAA